MSGSKHSDKTIVIGESLKRKGLSVTDSRKKIMQLFMQQKGALSHSDIENGVLVKTLMLQIKLHDPSFLDPDYGNR